MSRPTCSGSRPTRRPRFAANVALPAGLSLGRVGPDTAASVAVDVRAERILLARPRLHRRLARGIGGRSRREERLGVAGLRATSTCSTTRPAACGPGPAGVLEVSVDTGEGPHRPELRRCPCRRRATACAGASRARRSADELVCVVGDPDDLLGQAGGESPIGTSVPKTTRTQRPAASAPGAEMTPVQGGLWVQHEWQLGVELGSGSHGGEPRRDSVARADGGRPSGRASARNGDRLDDPGSPTE